MINVYQCELLLALKPAKYRTDSASTALGIGAKQAQALPHWCERPLLSNADVHRGLTLSFLCVCVCGGQRTTSGSHFCPSTMWALLEPNCQAYKK